MTLLIMYHRRLSFSLICLTNRSQRAAKCRVTVTHIDLTQQFSAVPAAIRRAFIQAPFGRNSWSYNNSSSLVGNMSKGEAAKQFVEMKIHGKKVVVFSKSYCPYCTMAKDALRPHVGKEIKPDQYEVIEIENRPDCSDIQAYLRKITGASSVSPEAC